MFLQVVENNVWGKEKGENFTAMHFAQNLVLNLNLQDIAGTLFKIHFFMFDHKSRK